MDDGYIQPKENVETAEKKIEEISLMVDTGGAYSKPRQGRQSGPADIFNKPSSSLDKDLDQAKESVEKKAPNNEPILSDIASVDPDKKFDYKKADTSKYKIKNQG